MSEPEIKQFNVKPRPMMDHMMRIGGEKTRHLEHLEELFKGVKNLVNLMQTDAGQAVIEMADKEVEGKKCISAEKWNAYVAEQFPHVTAKPVNNYITLVDAMNSLTTYIVQEKAAQKAEEKAALQAKSREEGGEEKAPDMGV